MNTSKKNIEESGIRSDLRHTFGNASSDHPFHYWGKILSVTLLTLKLLREFIHYWGLIPSIITKILVEFDFTTTNISKNFSWTFKNRISGHTSLSLFHLIPTQPLISSLFHLFPQFIFLFLLFFFSHFTTNSFNISY
jgi:hypothetical protein